MTAVRDAIERGNSARGKKPKWEAVDVEYVGWLTARVKKIDTGQVEGVYIQQGSVLFTELGWKDGKPKVHDVRDAELKRVVRAMLEPDNDLRDALIDETWRKRRRESLAKLGKVPE